MKILKSWIILGLFLLTSTSLIAKNPNKTQINLTLPGLGWGMDVTVPGYWLVKTNLNSDGKGIHLKANSKDNLMMTAFIEPAPYDGNHIDCREYYWKKGHELRLKVTDARRYEQDSIAIIDYIVDEYMGQEINQKHVHAFWSYEGYWIEVHLSAHPFEEEHQEFFESIISKILKIENYQPPVSLVYLFANHFYKNKNYQEAITYLKKTIELENDKEYLETNFWIDAIGDLGIIYINHREWQKAIELYKYGISKLKRFPFFYYALASVYGHMGEKNLVLENLKKAYDYAGRLKAKTLLPNPFTEPSFQLLLEDPDFKEEVRKFVF